MAGPLRKPHDPHESPYITGEGWDAPVEATPAVQFTWLHIPGGKGTLGLNAVVLSEKPIHYRGHYVGKPGQQYMVPCTKEGCLYCTIMLAQKRFVISAFAPQINTVGLMEFGEPVAAQILAIMQKGEIKGLRGTPLYFRREAGRERGRVIVTPAAGEFLLPDLPPPLDAQAALEETWARQKLKHKARGMMGQGGHEGPV